MKIIQNVIPVSLQNQIENTINDGDFPWYFLDVISAPPCPDRVIDIPKWDESVITNPLGLTYMIYADGKSNSIHFDLFRSVLYFLEEKENFVIDEILRMRIRRTIKSPNHTLENYNPPHVDIMTDKPFKTLVYYVSDSDGDTILFDNLYKEGSMASITQDATIALRSPAIKGNGVLFEGNRFHAGNTPTNYQIRTIINFDFTIR